MKWKLVPVEPMPEMIDAWNNDDSDEFRHAYQYVQIDKYTRRVLP